MRVSLTGATREGPTARAAETVTFASETTGQKYDKEFIYWIWKMWEHGTLQAMFAEDVDMRDRAVLKAENRLDPPTAAVVDPRD